MKKPPGTCAGGGRTIQVLTDNERCWLCGRIGGVCPFFDARNEPFNQPFRHTSESWREQYRAARAKMLGRKP